MGRPSTQNAYSQSAGLTGILAPVQEPRDPTNLDVNYVLYREWINTTNSNYWKLMSFTSTSGTVLANWLEIEGTTNEVHTLTGNSGGAVGPTANNINVLGTVGQITVTGDPVTSTLTLALAGGGTAIDSIGVDAATGPGTNPVVPTGAGLVTITGGQVASGTVGANVIRTDSLLANNLTIEIQRSAAVSATDSTKNGVAHFSSDEFSVDANGFVTLKGGGEAIDSFIPDSGTSPVVPAANGSVTMSGSGSITTVGGTNQLTTQLTGLTNHAVLVGAGTTTITKVGPSATTGAPLISGGAAADPGFSTTFRIDDADSTVYFVNSVPSGGLQFEIENTSTGSNAVAGMAILTQAGTGNSPYALFEVFGTPNYIMTIGLDQSGNFNMIPSGNIDVWTSPLFRVSQAGAITFNSAYTFPTTDGTSGQVLTTNGAGQLSFASSGAGGWTAIGASQTLAVNNGYFCTSGAALSLALPAVSSVGDTIEVVLDGSTSWTITQPNAGTRIRIGNQQTTLGVGGSLASTLSGDTVKLVCETANARWAVVSMIGNITVV